VHLVERLLHRVQGALGAIPSMVVTSQPSAWTAKTVQLFTASPSRWTVHAPQLLVSQPDDGADLAQLLAQVVDEKRPRFDVVGVDAPSTRR
jgi:hypothetical protein